MIRSILSATAALLLVAPALAGPDDFKPGMAIPAFGKVASVPDAERLSKDAVFKIAFDTAAETTGVAGSPRPPMGASLSTKWTSISGHSERCSIS